MKQIYQFLLAQFLPEKASQPRYRKLQISLLRNNTELEHRAAKFNFASYVISYLINAIETSRYFYKKLIEIILCDLFTCRLFGSVIYRMKNRIEQMNYLDIPLLIDSKKYFIFILKLIRTKIFVLHF